MRSIDAIAAAAVLIHVVSAASPKVVSFDFQKSYAAPYGGRAKRLSRRAPASVTLDNEEVQ